MTAGRWLSAEAIAEVLAEIAADGGTELERGITGRPMSAHLWQRAHRQDC